MHPRSINLSENIVSFAMPENFSSDFPAEDMVESVDLSDYSVSQDPKDGTLIRRWWDIKESSFFGKDSGSLMMSIYIKKKSDDSDWEIRDRFGFVKIIDHALHELYDEHNRDVIAKGQSELEMLLPYIEYNYMETLVNGQRWLAYSLEKKRSMSHIQAIPITEQHYLEVDFTFLPNDNKDLREFVLDVSDSHVKPIMNTFHIEYVKDNAIKQNVEALPEPPLKALIKERLE